METFVFFRHRHQKEREQLNRSFLTGLPFSEATKKKLLLTQAYDFRKKVLEEVRTKPMFNLFENKNTLESFDQMIKEDCGVTPEEKATILPMFLEVKKMGGFRVNFIDAYVVDDDEVVAEQVYMINKNKVFIMMMSTKENYRKQGIATSLLEQVEHIVFDQLQLDCIRSTATSYSKGIFESRGYTISPFDHAKERGKFMSVEADIGLTREDYLARKQEMGE